MKTYFDIAGDGGSDIIGQVERLKKKIHTNLSPLSCRLAIGSGKGGVGKSTLSMLLALIFRQRGIRSVLLDADFNGPSQARLAGLAPSLPLPGKNGLQVPVSKQGVGVVSFGTLVPEPEAIDFHSVSAGDSHTWRAAREFAVLAEILAGTDWTPFEFLLLDLPPGTERMFQYAEFLGPETAFILVTLPSSLSRGVVVRSHTALLKTESPVLGYMENMSGYYCPDCGAVKPLFPENNEVELPLDRLGSVPFDPRLAALSDHGLSFDQMATSPVIDSMAGICDRIGEKLENRK